jgi:NADH-quinone oxidoreductase subunit N
MFLFINLVKLLNFNVIPPFFYEFYLSLLILYYILWGIFLTKYNFESLIGVNKIFSILNFFFIFLLFCIIINIVLSQGMFVNNYFFENVLLNSFIILYIKAILLFAFFFTYLNLFKYFLNNYFFFMNGLREFPIIFFGSIIFSFLFIATNNLFFMLNSLIGLSLSLYAIINFNSILGKFTVHSLIKYYLMSTVSSLLIYGGLKEIYLNIGSLDFNIINEYLIQLSLMNNLYLEHFFIKISLFFICAGFFFKLTIAPSHFWAPEVYNTLSYSAILFFTFPIKITTSFMFLKIFKNIFFINSLIEYLNFRLLLEIEYLILIVIFLSLFLGSINSIFEYQIKKFIAYSSVNQFGFLLIGVLGLKTSLYGLQAYIYFFFIYLINMGIFFFIIFWYLNSYKLLFINKSNKVIIKLIPELIFMSDLKKINQIQNLLFIVKTATFTHLNFEFKIIKLLIVFLFFSLAGIPPTIGFLSKFYIILYAFNLEFIFLVIFILFISILTGFYYLRCLKIIFFENVVKKTLNENIRYIRITSFPKIYNIIYNSVLLCLFLIIIFWFIYFDPIIFKLIYKLSENLVITI